MFSMMDIFKINFSSQEVLIKSTYATESDEKQAIGFGQAESRCAMRSFVVEGKLVRTT